MNASCISVSNHNYSANSVKVNSSVSEKDAITSTDKHVHASFIILNNHDVDSVAMDCSMFHIDSNGNDGCNKNHEEHEDDEKAMLHAVFSIMVSENVLFHVDYAVNYDRIINAVPDPSPLTSSAKPNPIYRELFIW